MAVEKNGSFKWSLALFFILLSIVIADSKESLEKLSELEVDLDGDSVRRLRTSVDPFGQAIAIPFFQTPSGGAHQLWRSFVQLKVSKPDWSEYGRMITLCYYPPWLSDKSGVTGLIRWTRPEGAATGTVKNRELLITNSQPAQFSQVSSDMDEDGFESIYVKVENVWDVSINQFVTLHIRNKVENSAQLFEALTKAGACGETAGDPAAVIGGTVLWQGWVQRKFGEDEDCNEWPGPNRLLRIIQFTDVMPEFDGGKIGLLTWKRPEEQYASRAEQFADLFIKEEKQAQFLEGFPMRGDDFQIKIENLFDQRTGKWRTLYLKGAKLAAMGAINGEENVRVFGGVFKRDIMPALVGAGVIDVSDPRDGYRIKDGK